MMGARRPRTSARLRLTLTYSALFVVTGAALLSVSYVLVKNREHSPATDVAVLCRRSTEVTPTQMQVSGFSAGPAGTVTSCQGAVESVETVPSSTGSGTESEGAARAHRWAAHRAHPAWGRIRRVDSSGRHPDLAAQSDGGGRPGPHPEQFRGREGGIALALMTIATLGLSWWIAGPGALTGAPHYRRGPSPVGTDPSQSDQPERPR